MKMNKLAAGALALALGLGAVAPAVAAEKKNDPVPSYVLEEYEKAAADLTKARLAAIDAQRKIDAAKEALDKAEAELNEAKKAYEAQFKPYLQYFDAETGEEVALSVIFKKPVEEAAKKLNGSINETVGVDGDIDGVAAGTVTKTTVFNWAKSIKKDGVSDEDLTALVERYVNAIVRYNKDTALKSRLQSIYQRYLTAQYAYDEALVRHDEVKKANQPIVDAYDTEFERVTKLAKSYGLTVQVYNNGVQIVKPGDDLNKPAKKPFDIKELRAAREKAITTLEAVKLLEELAPQKIADVKEDLDALVKEQKDLIKKADKVLEKKAAFIATAYAAEEDEEMSVEELTDKLNEKSDKIQDLIKDKEEPAEDDEEPAEDEEKPAEDDKEDEEKPAENKPSKGAGNNAKTGIAGVAGVAGILAAASVAYATSKRD